MPNIDNSSRDGKTATQSFLEGHAGDGRTPWERFLAAHAATVPALAGTLSPDEKRFEGQCPSHDDAVASLSACEAEDGKVLVRCHAGCDTAAVLIALGLRMADLFPAAHSKDAAPPVAGTGMKRSGKSYATRKRALKVLDRIMAAKVQGERAGRWVYRDAAGRIVALIVRYNMPTAKGSRQRKTFRPISRHPDGWRLADPPGDRWPLYNLAALAASEPVYVCEGEKAAAALAELGLPVTTSAHGASAPAKTDWRPLAGKEVILLPDHDEAGRDYAEAVAGILTALDPPARVKVVVLDFPGRAEHADAVEWIGHARREGPGDARLRCRLEKLAATALPVDPRDLGPQRQSYVPFPVDALPEPLRSFVVEAAAALACDPCFVALPALAVVAGLIGNTRTIRLKRDWQEPAVLWTAVVAYSGTVKSPAARLVLAPLFRMQRELLDKHKAAMEAFEAAKAMHEKELKACARGAGTDPGPMVEKPVCKRFVCSDITIERLAEILQDNPRGVLVHRDELAGWVGSFGRYRGKGGGSDLPAWLEMHRAETVIVDRKGDDRKTVFVPRAAVSVSGGIQPGTLARVVATEEALESGLLARLLLGRPPRTPKVWSDAEISQAAQERYEGLLKRLAALPVGQETGGEAAQAAGQKDGGEMVPVPLSLSPEARREWVAFFKEWAAEQAAAEGPLAAALAKLEGYAARLALIHHVVTHVGLETDDRREIGIKSISAGITLARWFGGEARRLYAELVETEDERQTRQLVEYITARGGRITARELQRSGPSRFRPAGAAEKALTCLVNNRLAEWRQREAPQGGRAARECVLLAACDMRHLRQLPAAPAEPEAAGAEPACDTTGERVQYPSVLDASVASVSCRIEEQGDSGGTPPRAEVGGQVSHDPGDSEIL
jgi:hypothetical protein